MARPVFQSSSLFYSSQVDTSKTSVQVSNIFGSKLRSWEIEQGQLRFLDSSKGTPTLKLKAVMGAPSLTAEIIDNKQKESKKGSDLFQEMKQRFLSFKNNKYMDNLDHYQNLANCQAPKFMVIACADSRVCPSSILGFQPGEAFVIRNIANLVPAYESGPSETNAGLEFAVNSLKVENILVVGHSCCGGIRALMSMEDESSSSSFISNWVVIGKSARLRTKSAVSNLDFDQQCRHCEKESINNSLLNLLTYPWIKEKVKEGTLSIHGGYYNFVNCTFEKWTLDYDENSSTTESGCSIRNREFWS